MKMKDYYKILEVESTATLEQIKAQYRFLIQAWHPDKFPNSELKAKAEEKVKDINEAYSILSDPVKRENYDRSLRSYSSPPKQEPQYSQQTYSHSQRSQPEHAAPKAEPKEYCQSCGLPVETKYVEFYENIGMIFMRQHRAVKGKLCKPCIDYYFWNLTGKTMLIGWWSFSSIVITPFILINNLFRFIFTTGMKKPPAQIAPSPSPFWVFSTIGGFLMIGYFLFSMFSPASAQQTYSTPPTRASTPIHVPTKIKTPTVPASNCIQWSEVSDSMIGKNACVYGSVYKTRHVGESTFQILFSNNDKSFFLASGAYFYEVGSGDCVVAEGVISRSGANVPYMNIDEALYQCESWME